MKAGIVSTVGGLAAMLLGLLTYEVVALGTALVALAVGSAGLWRAERLSRRMDAWLDDQAERTEVQRSEFRDRLDGG